MTTDLTLAAVAYNMAGAVAATGIGENTISYAAYKDELVAHYIGIKPVFRALDLDDWIARLPDERGGLITRRPGGASRPALAAVSYSTAGAVAATGIGKSTIDRAVRLSDLAVHYVGSKRVFRATDLDDWIRSLPTESSRPRPRQIFDLSDG